MIIDTRPWVLRVALGEIPRTPAYVSFMDLFRTDYNSGAKILKTPEDLRAIFVAIPNMKFNLQE